ncbi:Serine threonine-kinase CTR1 [Micractinium conductrix]|uniref:Serine threonine-kinase CTR1 n=1 Tax=Micractinium conductrix TaxID=554055 RepID=A0A2P6V8K5_9CHLO|nr:Serine threonine-kinase CTR1 [Micractinium conductrix]|eukprot:PSC70418.1 Serine threonine-kinase CTR1 [Micractinium conductrix]
MQQMFQTPVAAVSIIGEELDFVSRAGDWACSATREGSFCDFMLVPVEPVILIVEDASQDPRFANNTFVAGEPHIRFYAGAPLVSTNSGHRYGTLCVFDFKPRSFDAGQYAVLCHFAEILVREMEVSLAVSWQQEQLRRAEDKRSHLLRAMDCFHEGIVLLDMSSEPWMMVWANDAFRQAAAMPDLLVDAGAAAGSCGGSSGGSQTALQQQPAAVSFWEHFQQVLTSQDSYNAALLAMSNGRDFIMTVRPATADGDTDSQPALTVLFRPAETEQLRDGMPQIGIPAWVGGGNADARLARLEAATEPAQLRRRGSAGGASTSGDCSSKPVPAPVYYFGVLRQGQQAPAHWAPALPVAVAASPRKPVALSQTSSGSGESSGQGSERGMQLGASVAGLGERDVSALIIPAFFQMRPGMLSEVTLGPLIGVGSCGRCYRGTWQGGRVAVKVIDCWSRMEGSPVARGSLEGSLPCSSPQGPQAAVVEALLSRSLAHPHCVSTYTHGVSVEQFPDTGREHHQVWLVGEYCNRGSLLDAIDRGLLHHPRTAAAASSSPAAGGPPCSSGPNLPAILAAAEEIAGVLTYLHANDVIHGDLTPSNVLLTSAAKDPRRWVCKVADFGLSLITQGEDSHQRPGFGTITHMPPELLSNGTLTKSTDVYSFGIIVCEMWHGRRAWLGDNPVRVLAQASSGILPFVFPGDMPAPLASLLKRCLHEDPSQRPSFAAILSEVQAIAAAQQQQKQQQASRQQQPQQEQQPQLQQVRQLDQQVQTHRAHEAQQVQQQTHQKQEQQAQQAQQQLTADQSMSVPSKAISRQSSGGPRRHSGDGPLASVSAHVAGRGVRSPFADMHSPFDLPLGAAVTSNS